MSKVNTRSTAGKNPQSSTSSQEKNKSRHSDKPLEPNFNLYGDQEEKEVQDCPSEDLSEGNTESGSEQDDKVVEDTARAVANLEVVEKTPNRRLSTMSFDGAELQRQSVSINAAEHPILSEYSRSEVVEFLEKKKIYDNHCLQYNAKPVSIRDMIDINLRESICTIDLRDQVTPSEVDSEELNEVLDNFVNESRNDAVSREDAFEEIQMDLKIADPQQRVHDYSQRVTRMLRENGWIKEYKGKDASIGMKRKYIKFLIKGIKPDVVAERVRIEVDQLKGSLATKAGEFWHILKANAISQNRYHGKRTRRNDEREDRSNKRRKKNDKEKKKNPKYESKEKDTLKKRESKSHFNKTTSCFGCQGNHRLADCNKFSASEKQDIIAKKKTEWQKAKDAKRRD